METEENEYREYLSFQLEMLETQISCKGRYTFLSIITAVSYSLFLSMYAISLTDISERLSGWLQFMALVSAVIGAGSLFYLSTFYESSVSRKIQKIRDRFIGSKQHDKKTK